MEKATFIQCLFNVILYLLILRMIWPLSQKSISFRDQSFHKKYRACMVLGFVFCLFPYWAGDYMNMWRDYRLARQGVDSNWETIYSYLSNSLPNYTSLRIVIWGAAFFFLNKLIKSFSGIEAQRYILLYFFAICLPNFSYLRSAISMAMICLALNYMINAVDKEVFIINKKMLFPIILLGSSFFFHKSAIFGIAIAIISRLSIYFKNIKIIILLFIALIPFAAQYANNWMEIFLGTSALEESSINIYAAQRYFDDSMDFGPTGLGMYVQNILSRAQYYLFLALYLFLVYNGRFKALPSYVRCFGNFAAIAITAATLTQFVLNITSSVLFYRLLYFSMIPITIVFAYCYQYNICSKYCKTSLMIAILGTLYTFVYSTYNMI